MDAGGAHFGVTQTRIIVSFPETDPSVIQDDNWLAGGMFVTGYDSTLHQIDYGFYTMLVLHHDGNLYFDVGIYQTYEGLNYLFSGGLVGDPPWSKLLYSATWGIGGVSPSTPITLIAWWDESAGLIYWSFTVPGNSPFIVGPFNITAVAPTINRRFYVGTQTLGLEYIWVPYRLTYLFQFGVFSDYNIGHGGWNVKLEYPQYYTDRWYVVDIAKSIGGANAFFDATWRWGGENYEGVNAYYYNNQPSLGRYKIIFYYSGSTLSDHTLLWAQNDAGKGVDAGNSFDSATSISSGGSTGELYQPHDTNDWYQFYASSDQTIYAAMTPPAGVDFDLELYNPSRALKIGSYAGAGITDNFSYGADSSGYWRIRIYIFSGGGQYFFSVWVVTPDGGGGGGGGGSCPYVSTWDEDEYMLDNNLLQASESSGGTDVTDYYVLQQRLAQREDGSYSLLLSEFENEHSFFDQAQLLAVDHPSNVTLAVSPYGEILTYTNPSPPVSAIDNNDRQVKNLINSIDGRYYEGRNGSYITLNFGEELDVSQGAKLVIRSDMPIMKSPIHIQTMNSDGNWETVATIHTRTYWSTVIIDMSKHLPDARGNLKVRLHFVSNDRIDFVGLDTTSQAAILVREGQLVSALHSKDGDVTTKLLYSDQTFAELILGESIELTFTLPQQTLETRNYIIIIEGRYYTIKT